MVKLFLSRQEFKNRIEKVKEEISNRELDALYLSDRNRVFYTTGYHYLATRPQGCLIQPEGQIMFFVPIMEEKRLRENWPWYEDIVTYFEYPVKNKPYELLDILAQTFKDRNLDDKKIGIDGPVLLTVPDFRAPNLSERLPNAKFEYAGDIVDDLRMIKSKQEIDLIEEAAKWCNLAHTLLHQYIEPGESELEISSRASHEATSIMLKTLGPVYEPLGLMWTTARARFKAGKRIAYPHGYHRNRKVRHGDVVETSGSARVGGYFNHLERTMFVGEPTGKMEKYFNLMVKAQDVAFESLRPGNRASNVHIAVKKIIKKEGYEPDSLMLHRTGRALGLDGYEPPTLVNGDNTILKPGMIFHVEPAIYTQEYCFRHCDTVLITEDGHRNLDYYPRDIEYLTIY